ncbi:MAG: MlaD family protein, partial [Planctomycetota bacterium]|nr:MlaD family protein [Planctomycetota bacterium]
MTVPQAVATPERRGVWVIWLVPVVALVVTLWLWGRALADRGPVIHIVFDDAHGLKLGDPLRFRGMDAGVVEDLDLDMAEASVTVALRLRRDAADLARGGSRFWIERPILGVDGVSGLDTVIAGRHVAVLPGKGEPLARFEGLPRPPVHTPDLDNALELVLEAAQRGGLVAGAPVLYRQVPVGRVLSTALAIDGRTVEVRIAVGERYAALVRAETRFWQVGGVQLEAGLFNGLELKIDSLAALVHGGVAFATPPQFGDAVATGHRYRLYDGPKADWLTWAPSLPVGTELGAVIGEPPPQQRLALTWTGSGWW